MWFELPDTYSQLTAAELGERLAETVVAETRHLDPKTRRRVDAQLKAAGISRMGFKTATAYVGKAAYEADRHGYVQRAGPNANTAASGSGQPLTRLRC